MKATERRVAGTLQFEVVDEMKNTNGVDVEQLSPGIDLHKAHAGA